MREKIGKALKTRAEAIRHALDDYNQCATALRPPRPTLTWHDIMEMASLAEFDLLRDAREDVRDYPWAQRLNRQAMNLHFNIERAREEIARLNVELPRLFTSLVDRHFDVKVAIASLQDTDPALAYELQLRWEYDDRISARISARLYDTSRLEGFSGVLETGQRIGREPSEVHNIELPVWACRTAPITQTVDLHVASEERHGRDGDTASQEHYAMTRSVETEASRCDGDGTEDGTCHGIPGIESEGDAIKLVDFLDGLE